ncbi:MAG TPA: hypothetical protein VGK19_22780 [Capsulimonadaceae bacterium]|jgi:hypothetical protein
MTTPATTPRTRRLRIAAIVTGTLAALAAALYAIDTRTDAISCALRIPAKLDASTPAKQGGFEVVGIGRGYPARYNDGRAGIPGREGAMLPGDTLVSVVCRLPPSKQLRSSSINSMFHASGRSSTGSKFAIDVLEGWMGHEAHPSNRGDRLFFAICLPGTYPPNYRWIDITVTSTENHTATWRITRLPRTHRAIQRTDAVNSAIVTPDGIHAEYVARAVGENRWSLSSTAWQTQIGSRSDTHYELIPDLMYYQSEFETKDIASGSADWPYGSVCIRSLEMWPGGTKVHVAQLVRGGYPETRRVRLFASLARIATLDEVIRFPDLPIVETTSTAKTGSLAYLSSPPANMAIVTPSGIKVTLLKTEYTLMKDQCRLQVTTTPKLTWADNFNFAPSTRLTSSPLCAKYGKDVQIIAKSLHHPDVTSIRVDGGVELSFVRSTDSSAKAGTLPIRIRQRCILERIPVSFTFDVTKLPIDAPAAPKATRKP